ncbi:MAG: hypothetical protein KGJ21_01930 [Pseudomonadota bacterium]|nr:hypothetical protein [Pseudomonadota bacterium]
MTPLEIGNDEWFYRPFQIPDPNHHYEVIDGMLRLSRGIWNDRTYTPSVDRALLLFSPQEAQFDSTNAVVKIQAKEVRAISGNASLADSNTSRAHDIIFDKKEDRPAHSLITTTPPFADKPTAEKKKWKEFQRLLSLAAEKHGWVIAPQEV